MVRPHRSDVADSTSVRDSRLAVSPAEREDRCRRSMPRNASASSSVWTGTILTSDGRVLLGVGRVFGRHHEVRDVRAVDRGHLLFDAADLAHRPVGRDRSGGRDLLAARQVTRRQLVEQTEREREPGTRPADALRVDRHVERQRRVVEPVVGADAEETRSRLVRMVGQRDLGVTAIAVGILDAELTWSPGLCAPSTWTSWSRLATAVVRRRPRSCRRPAGRRRRACRGRCVTMSAPVCVGVTW